MIVGLRSFTIGRFVGRAFPRPGVPAVRVHLVASRADNPVARLQPSSVRYYGDAQDST